MKYSIRYSYRRRFWQGMWGALSAAFLCVLSPVPASASTQEFTVLAVGIDYNSERADLQALDYARKRAVYLAIKKLGVKEPTKAAARIKDEDFAQIIRGTTVKKSTRQLDKTYLEVVVSIVDQPLRAALGLPEPEAVTGAVDGAMRPVLVLPAVVMPKKTFVWDKDNPLRGPLASELLRQAHGVVMLPGGDLADLRLVDGDNIAKVTTEELKPMFDRYAASEIILVLVKPGTLGTEEPDMVVLRRLNSFDPHNEMLEVKPKLVTEDTPTRMARVAQVVAQATVQIASSTAQTMRQRLDASTKIPVKFIYTIPRELAQMTEVIRQVEGVLLLELPSIKLNNVAGTIYLEGDKTVLKKALAAKGIICRDQGNEWTISIR